LGVSRLFGTGLFWALVVSLVLFSGCRAVFRIDPVAMWVYDSVWFVPKID